GGSRNRPTRASNRTGATAVRTRARPAAAAPPLGDMAVAARPRAAPERWCRRILPCRRLGLCRASRPAGTDHAAERASPRADPGDRGRTDGRRTPEGSLRAANPGADGGAEPDTRRNHARVVARRGPGADPQDVGPTCPRAGYPAVALRAVLTGHRVLTCARGWRGVRARHGRLLARQNLRTPTPRDGSASLLPHRADRPAGDPSRRHASAGRPSRRAADIAHTPARSESACRRRPCARLRRR